MGAKGRQDRADASTVELLALLQHKSHTLTRYSSQRAPLSRFQRTRGWIAFCH
ncbi:uncharacterized protein STEHIDRAFT_120113 [Stereum hirsutum FP-91666 SS1]|uniref:uncharacterized protein n=1 Tax=Stereum hirsutum (strain FP-91666) TaxID=721885 RepID=UPI000440A773|nr:uncharacterized protein STEHIDRAFT_120113 [Stereum hirsutum FP-91666 SS1]EIM87842.1 hypothetical protein STEHIDRAFT_120113 [Stereum hirsutum FP-91666 SS1]